MNIGTLTIEMAANVARLQKDMQRATRTVDGAMGQIRRSADMATRALGGLIGALGAREVINAIDSYTRFNAQLRLATRSTEEFVRAQGYVTAIARESYRDLNSIGVLYARISNATRDLGISQERVVNITRSVALAMQVSGATATESASAMLQLSQAFASGVLRGEEFNAVNEAAPRLMKALADGLNVPIGSLRELAQNGEITSALLADALPKALQDLIKESKQIQTISGSFQQLKNEVLLFVGATGEANNVTSSFAIVLGDIAAILSAFNTATEKATGNSQTMKVVLEGIAITFETLAVLGVNLVYVFEMVAREIVGIGKQIGALATLNMDEFNAIGTQMTAYAEQRRAEVDALTERILNARKLAAEARKEAEVGNDILSRAAAINDNFQAAALGAAGAAKDAEKAYDSLLTKLRGEVVKGTAELQAEQQDLNKSQEDFLILVTSPEWKTYTEAQRILVTDLYKQRIETEKLVDAEKKRKDENAKRLKQMEDDYKEMLDFINEEDAKAEAKRLKALEDMYNEHKREIEKIGDQLTDALMRAFESGKGFGQAFKDTLVNMFRTMVLRPVLAPISGAFASAFAPSAIAGPAGGMSGSMGFLGGIAAASGALGTGIAAGFTNALSLNFAGSLQAAGSLIGTGAMSGIAAGAGMIAGTLLPIVGAVSLIKSLTGGDGKDPTGMGAFFTTRGVGVSPELISQTTGYKVSSQVVNDFFERANEGLQPVVGTMVDTILDRTQDRARAIGLDIALGIDAGLVADPAAKASYGYASIFMGEERVGNIVNRALGADFEQATVRFSEQLQEAVAKAVLDAGNIVIPAGQTATAVLERLGSSILTVNSTFETLGLSLYETSIAGAEMAAALVDLLGGVENFTQLSAQYYQDFYSEAERTEILTRQLTGTFSELGLALPASREAFRALVESQDLSTQSGRELVAALMQLSPAFASITQSIDEVQATVVSMVQEIDTGALEDAYNDSRAATDAALQSLRRAIDAQKDSLNLTRDIAEQQVSDIRSVFDVLNNAILGLTGGGFTATTGRAFIEQALQTAQTTGYLPNADELSRAITAATSGTQFASAFEQRREQALLVARLTQLRGFADDQLTVAEEQLLTLDKQLEALDEQYEQAVNQVNLLRGIDSGIKTIPEAIATLQSALQAELKALGSLTRTTTVVRGGGGGGGLSGYDAGAQYEAGITGPSTITIGGAAASSPGIVINPGFTGFAAGGLHEGGMRMVGERGPELEVTGPARYMSNATLASMMGNGNNEELKQLREENKVQMRALVSLQSRMTRLLERWDGDGLPEERAVA